MHAPYVNHHKVSSKVTKTDIFLLNMKYHGNDTLRCFFRKSIGMNLINLDIKWALWEYRILRTSSMTSLLSWVYTCAVHIRMVHTVVHS